MFLGICSLINQVNNSIIRFINKRIPKNTENYKNLWFKKFNLTCITGVSFLWVFIFVLEIKKLLWKILTFPTFRSTLWDSSVKFIQFTLTFFLFLYNSTVGCMYNILIICLISNYSHYIDYWHTDVKNVLNSSQQYLATIINSGFFNCCTSMIIQKQNITDLYSDN